jgi:ferredoxin
MKVRVDLALCQGHARCQDHCPEVFGTDDLEGKCVILISEVPVQLQQSASRAVNNCPEGALSLCND